MFIEINWIPASAGMTEVIELLKQVSITKYFFTLANLIGHSFIDLDEEFLKMILSMTVKTNVFDMENCVQDMMKL